MPEPVDERLFRLIMGHRRLVIALLAVITATLGKRRSFRHITAAFRM